MFPLFHRNRRTKAPTRPKTLRKLNLETLEERVNPNVAYGYAISGYAPGDTGTSTAQAVATDSSGDVFVTGNFNGSVNFDGTTKDAGGVADAFVMKISAAGTLDWVADFGGPEGYVKSDAIVVDSAGNVFTTGTFQGNNLNFDPHSTNQQLTSSDSGSEVNAYVSELNATGQFVFVSDIGYNATSIQASGIALDSSDNVYTVGSFTGSGVNFGSGHLLTSSLDGTNSNAYVSALNSSGGYVFAVNLGYGPSTAYGYGIAVDGSGNVFTTGEFTGSNAQFDPSNGNNDLNSSGGYNAFVSELNSSGQYISAEDIVYSGTASGNAIAVDSSDNVYVTGVFTGNNVNFDPNSTNHQMSSTASGYKNAFVSELNAGGQYVFAEELGYGGNTSGSSPGATGQSITLDSAGNIYSTGTFAGLNRNFNPTNSNDQISSGPSGAASNAYVSELNSSGQDVFGVDLGYGGTAIGSSISVDPAGNVFTTGYFQGSAVNFDPSGTQVLYSTPTDQSSFYLSKLTTNGPSISTNPLNVTIDAGGNASFVSTATGVPAPTEQWQVSTNGGLTFTNISNFSVIAASPNGATESGTTVTITTTSADGFVAGQPVTISGVGVAGYDGTFTILAVPTANTFTYTDGATGLAASGGGIATGVYSGATSSTLVITGATSTMDQYIYQAVFTNSVNTSTSTEATLTVDFTPIVTTPPTNTTILLGGNATFTAVAAAEPAASVQWQVSTNGGATFTNTSDGTIYSGSTTDTLKITGAPASMNGYEYQAVFSNTILHAASPGFTTSAPATLQVDFAVAITASPTNETVDAGSNTTFTVSETGSPFPAIEWLVSTNGGLSYTVVTNSSIYSGATTTALTITGATASMNSDVYKAILSNTLLGSTTPSTATSFSANLIVDYAPTVTTSPVNTTIKAGTNVSLTAVAPANPAPTVQWFVSTNSGGTFALVTNGGVYSNATTPTLGIIGATPAMNGYEYQAVFTNTLFGAAFPSTATTATAILTVDYAPKITTNPMNVTIPNGGNASFTAAATSGFPVATSVQWQLSSNGGVSFVNLTNGAGYSGVTTTTLTITGATNSFDLNQYRAAFSNAGNLTTPSAYATLYVQYPPIVTLNPSNATTPVRGTATFSANAAGDAVPTVQWQISYNGGVSFYNLANTGNYSGVTTNVLSVSGVTLSMSGLQFRAQFTNPLGGPVSTAAATLTATYSSQYTTLAYDYTYTAYYYAYVAYLSGLGSYTAFQDLYYAYIDADSAMTTASAGNQASAQNYAYYAYYYGYYGQYYAYLDYALSGGASALSYYAYLDGYYGQYYSYFAAQGY